MMMTTVEWGNPVIRCGMYEADITPPLGSSIPGYFYDRKSTGIKDRIYSKACVLASADGIVAIISVDAIDLSRDVVEGIRDKIYAYTQIPSSQIMISATHTHTGPPTFASTFIERNEAYLHFLIDKTADAAICAYQRLQAAKIAFFRGREESLSFNRRYWMKDGTLRTNPGIGNPHIDRAAGTIDPEVLAIWIDDMDGHPIGVISNFACHTDTVEGTEYSADYPGEISAIVKKRFGEQTVSLFLMGASGDINHIDVNGNLPIGRDHYRTMGRKLANRILESRENAEWREKAVIGSERLFFYLPSRKPSEDEVEQARQTISSGLSSDLDNAFAEELLKASACAETGVDIEIQVIAIGQLAVAGFPGELFAELGCQIKRLSLFPYTLINTLCNGSATGYVFPRQAFEHGGYETRITSNSKLAVESGEWFVRHGVELLRSVGDGIRGD